ncbi:hypothetical protein K491DRAFT_673186 [Lophiostoma macrostomum CBS 122681]|uniref:Uncharacterized protein n=1 Tax=Lophiostoma macrostomum CBS 122681 TaxID=1314788 RepID=A0A6A6TSC0_9PLEO|nr:hypothetical protein K491DRAFT_673186 [Lophiostoma macrostomum CBS 122681]
MAREAGAKIWRRQSPHRPRGTGVLALDWPRCQHVFVGFHRERTPHTPHQTTMDDESRAAPSVQLRRSHDARCAALRKSIRRSGSGRCGGLAGGPQDRPRPGGGPSSSHLQVPDENHLAPLLVGSEAVDVCSSSSAPRLLSPLSACLRIPCACHRRRSSSSTTGAEELHSAIAVPVCLQRPIPARPASRRLVARWRLSLSALGPCPAPGAQIGRRRFGRASPAALGQGVPAAVLHCQTHLCSFLLSLLSTAPPSPPLPRPSSSLLARRRPRPDDARCLQQQCAPPPSLLSRRLAPAVLVCLPAVRSFQDSPRITPAP